MSGKISLYFHIPFCSRKCDYCHFYVIPDKDPFKKVLKEGLAYEWQYRLPELTGKKIETIYFGGGTPALFGADAIGDILDKVREECHFACNDPEITLEANPETINDTMIRDYAAAGINRISIGIQTLDDTLLKRIGRQHDSTMAAESVNITHGAGIDNITVDLMYDLPGQTLSSWTHTLQTVTTLPITHLSLYNLTIEPRTVFYKYQERVKSEQPGENESLAMYKTAVEHLNDCGLRQYEISAFAKDGHLSKHNTGYWSARPFLGYGPSAYSYWNKSRFRNVANIHQWYRAVMKREDPADFRESLNNDAALAELLAINLRLLSGVNVSDFEKRHQPLPHQIKTSVQKLKDADLLKEQNGILSLTEQGIIFYDTVATEIIIC